MEFAGQMIDSTLFDFPPATLSWGRSRQSVSEAHARLSNAQAPEDSNTVPVHHIDILHSSSLLSSLYEDKRISQRHIYSLP